MKNSLVIIALYSLLMLCACSNSSTTTSTSEDTKYQNGNNDQQQEAEIGRLIANLNQSFSHNDNMFLNVESFDFQDNALIINITTNSDFIKISELKKNKDIQKREIIAKIKYRIWEGDDKIKLAFEYFAQNNIYGEIRYKDSTEPSKTYIIYLSTEDLVNMASCNEDPTQEVLEAQIESLNIHLPVDIDEYTIMRRLGISDGFLTYDYIVKEDNMPMEYLYENKDYIRANLKQNLFSQCDDDLMHQAKRQKLGYRYRYTGNKSGKKFAITFSNSELK